MVQVGDYLGDFPDFNGAILAEFVKGVPFSGLGFDDALRLFLTKFHLPGEAQKVDRFMEAFSKEYMNTHPGEFSNVDTPYVLAFSCIMLNTDHFNPGIKDDRKMTRQEFISNNRGVDEGLTAELLGTIYDRICANEIPRAAKVEASDTRSILCYSNPRKHGYLKKVTPGHLRNTEEKFWFVLKDRMLYYLESPPALGVEPLLCGMLPLDCNTSYQLGVSAHEGHHGKWLEMKNSGAGDVKGLKVRHRHHVHHYVESETRASFIFAAADDSEASEWRAAIEKALSNTREDYLEARDAALRPPEKPSTSSDASHEWLKLKLATHVLDGLRPHEVTAAKKWIAGHLVQEASDDSDFHHGDIDDAAEQALVHVDQAVFDSLPSGNEQSKAALMHWMLALQPADITQVKGMLKGLLEGEEVEMSDEDANQVMLEDVEALMDKVFAAAGGPDSPSD
jgi:hypothetical protein